MMRPFVSVASLAALLTAGAVMAQTVNPDIRPVARAAMETPASSSLTLHPMARPGTPLKQAQIITDIAAVRPVKRPHLRPDLEVGADTSPQRRADENLFARSPFAPLATPRPTVRPAVITQRAVDQQIASARGQVCGDPAIQGRTLGDVPGPGQCGVSGAVKVRSIAGVTLKPAATMDCKTAGALKAWVAQAAKPIVGVTGGGISSLRIVGSYSCRSRNGASTGRMSEHAFGRAVDIAGIGLKRGRELTVLTDWRTPDDGDMLKRMWQAACGPFGTVLGPNANAAHRDHFHFDTARYRSGSYCR